MLSLFLLSVPGDYWPWYVVMVPFSVVPLCFARRWYRVTGGVAFLLAVILIVGDVQSGKTHRQRIQRMKAAVTEKKSEPAEAPNERQ